MAWWSTASIPACSRAGLALPAPRRRARVSTVGNDNPGMSRNRRYGWDRRVAVVPAPYRRWIAARWVALSGAAATAAWTAGSGVGGEVGAAERARTVVPDRRVIGLLLPQANTEEHRGNTTQKTVLVVRCRFEADGAPVEAHTA